jgi:hypothetical protein
MNDKKILVFDFETSGLDFEKDRILEVGVWSSLEPEPKSWFVNQTEFITKEYLDERNKIVGLTPITWEQLLDGISPAANIVALTSMFDQHDLIVGHNIVKFDIIFYMKECHRLGLRQFLDWERLRDTAMMFKALRLGMIPDEGEPPHLFAKRVGEIHAKGIYFNLPLCTKVLKLIEDGRKDFHAAGTDVYYTMKLFKRFINPFNV